MFFTADHLIEKMNIFNKAINKNKSNLNENNIFVFGIKPKSPTSDYGYFLTKKIKGNINKVTRFIEKPKDCLLYTSPSPRDRQKSRMPSSA